MLGKLVNTLFVREPFYLSQPGLLYAGMLHVLLAVIVEFLDDASNHLFHEVHDVFVVKKSRFDIYTCKLGQVSYGMRVFRPEIRAYLEHPVKRKRQLLLVKLGALRKVRLVLEILEPEQVCAPLARTAYYL